MISDTRRLIIKREKKNTEFASEIVAGTFIPLVFPHSRAPSPTKKLRVCTENEMNHPSIKIIYKEEVLIDTRVVLGWG